MSREDLPGYAGNDKGRYEPPVCPRCGHLPEVDWVEISTWGTPDRWIPGSLLCRTPGCLDERGSNWVPS